MTTTEKARIAEEIRLFHNTDFSDCPKLTPEQLAQMRPSRHRNRKNKIFLEIPDEESPIAASTAIPEEVIA